MNADVKQKWVAALRSGEYAQGKGVLRDNEDKFCCLGVLCDLAEKEGVVDSSQGDDTWLYEGPGRPYGRDVSEVTLPDAVKDWAGLPKVDPRIEAKKNEKVTPSLSVLNDGWEYAGFPRHSFEEIADIIEEHL